MNALFGRGNRSIDNECTTDYRQVALWLASFLLDGNLQASPRPLNLRPSSSAFQGGLFAWSYPRQNPPCLIDVASDDASFRIASSLLFAHTWCSRSTSILLTCLQAIANMSITEINEIFAQPNKPLPEDVAGELQSIINLHSLSEQELFYKWEAYSIKMGAENTQMNYKTVRDFKKDLQDALERESRGKAHMQSASKRAAANTPRNANTGDVFGV